MKSLLVFLALFFAGLCTAQTASPPASSGGDISGMYTFLREGEFVQLSVEDGRLTGFVSRYGESESDKGAVLDQLFKVAEIKGNTIHFVTRQVHGTWFEFQGNIEPGEEKDPSKEGFRLIKGKLTQFTDGEKNTPVAKSRELTMKSFPMSELIGKSK